MQGNPYSQMYSYCFPFLWVQGQAEGPSVYPAVYEWYRGDTPALRRIHLLKREPLTVEVTTETGQTDTFVATGSAFSAVSRDAKGVRWAQINGGRGLKGKGISLDLAAGAYRTRILEMDHLKRRIRIAEPLPMNPTVVIGNEGRRSVLDLKGQGTEFVYDDSLLIHEGRVTKLVVTAGDTIAVETNQHVLFGGMGNRKLKALTQTNEAGTWQFRGGKVVAKPAGQALSEAVFADANGDGLIHLKTWEAGTGDTIELYANVIVRRKGAAYEVLTNVAVKGNVEGHAFDLEPSTQWQHVKAKLD